MIPVVEISSTPQNVHCPSRNPSGAITQFAANGHPKTTQCSTLAKDGALYLARAADFHRQKDIDQFVFPCLLARRAKAYGAKHQDFSLDDLSKIVAKAHV